ncbi:hypothetical protein MRX96_057288, partial [Rhipicephalus microplus]
MRDEIQAVVLDIEGTVISVNFVKDVLFPFARKNMRTYLESRWEDPELKAIVAQLHTQSTARSSRTPHSRKHQGTLEEAVEVEPELDRDARASETAGGNLEDSEEKSAAVP